MGIITTHNPLCPRVLLAHRRKWAEFKVELTDYNLLRDFSERSGMPPRGTQAWAGFVENNKGRCDESKLEALRKAAVEIDKPARSRVCSDAILERVRRERPSMQAADGLGVLDYER